MTWRPSGNGKATALGSDSVNSYAVAISISGDDIYIAGYQNSTQSNISNRIAMYWKNGTAIALSDGTVDATTTGIARVGSDLYVSGNMAGGVLWKDGAGQSLSYSAEGLYSYNNSLYLVGESIGYNGYSANVWTWGAGYTSFYLGGLSVNAITVDSSGVFTAGATPSSNWVPSYSVYTGGSPINTVLLDAFGHQEEGNAWAICLRH